MSNDQFSPTVAIRKAKKRTGLEESVRYVRSEVVKPYAFVTVRSDRGYNATGFAKCSPKDQFNPSIGLNLATSRAVHELAKKMAT